MTSNFKEIEQKCFGRYR